MDGIGTSEFRLSLTSHGIDAKSEQPRTPAGLPTYPYPQPLNFAALVTGPGPTFSVSFLRVPGSQQESRV